MNDFIFLKKTPYEIDKSIAERIRGIRKRRKITQKTLSERSGVSLGSIKRFESIDFIDEDRHGAGSGRSAGAAFCTGTIFID